MVNASKTQSPKATDEWTSAQDPSATRQINKNIKNTVFTGGLTVALVVLN